MASKIIETLCGAQPLRKSARDIAPNFFMEDGSIGPDHVLLESGIRLLGVGNPLLDISSKVPAEVLTKYEVKSGDIILAEDKHQGVYAELVDKYSPEYIAGGATQNSIRVCAWMLTAANVKDACAFTGCVGSDSNGAKLKECAEAGGVTVEYQVDAETPTGVCAVLVDPTNERTLITKLDAANNFNKAHLETEAVQKLLVSSKVVYSAGFFLTSGGPECTALLGDHCAEFGKQYCLNLSAPFIPMFFLDAIKATMPYVDILFANETEAAAFGKAMGWGEDVAKVALKAAGMPKSSGTRARTVVFTQGSDATIVAKEGIVTSYPVEKLSKDKLVDTNGAGDAFVGGFLAKLILGDSVSDCVKAGHYAARTIIQRSGCTVPSGKCKYGAMF